MRRLPIPLPPLVLGDGHSIQPVDPGTDFAREAARVERLMADRDLVDRVMWEGYVGPEWEKFRRALAEYGLAVLCAWIISGRIFFECKRRGFGGIARRRQSDEHEAAGLAGETIANALRYFRDRVLVPGLWDDTKGASLRTYFVGACIRHFPNVYMRSQGDERLELLFGEAETLSLFADPWPYSRPDRRVELANAVDTMDNSFVREVLLDEGEGYTQEESAKRLGVSRWTVEGRLRRFRPKGK